MKECIAQSKARVKKWTKSDWAKAGRVFDEICKDLVVVIRRGLPADSPVAQDIIRRHYQWLKQFWTPTREAYSGHSLLIVDSDLRKAYEAYDRRLPEFAAEAIKVFAERELE